MTIADLNAAVPLLPELFLTGSALMLLLFGVFRDESGGGPVTPLALLALIATLALVLLAAPGTQSHFAGAVVDDAFSRFMKALILAASAIALVLAPDFMRREGFYKFEYAVLMLLSTAGMMLMVSANDLMAMYLAIELTSLPLYVAGAIHRDNLRSSEAGLKYFVLGALSSGMLLYGCSLIYGYTGSTAFTQIAAVLQTGAPAIGMIFGLVFVLAGLAFKMSAVPFHMWTPDVYEGAPSPVTAFFAAAPKIAAIALLTRLVFDAFPSMGKEWGQIVIAIALGSMALGAFAAIGQRNIKRLMAYSSIGHVGYALIGLAAGTPEGVQGVAVYLAIYAAMTLGAFAFITGLRRADKPVETIDELSGYSRSEPMMALIFAVLLFSLAGIPWMAGFFAKFYVFRAAIDAGLYWLAVFGVLASVVGAYYYLRIVKVMYFDEPRAAFDAMAPPVKAVFALSGLFVFFYVLVPGPLVEQAAVAAKALF
jgi:NADH-quinone oxidoreductase subunit N